MTSAISWICRFALLFFAVSLTGAISGVARAEVASTGSDTKPQVIYYERGGMVAGEAEAYAHQTKSSVRQWELITPQLSPIGFNLGPRHIDEASERSYLKLLPDTRRTHADRLIVGQNFSNEPGRLAVLTYRVVFNAPGRYYVWVRAYSSGSEDNGLHVGLDGKWPESGRRMQWCEGKNGWRWESRQRTKEEHCGIEHAIYLDIEKAGEHMISFSMREDGFEFDQWLLTKDRDFKRPTEEVPVSLSRGDRMKLAMSRTERKRQAIESHAVVSGKLKPWHKVTVSVEGPSAKDLAKSDSPTDAGTYAGLHRFLDFRMSVRFTHASGKPSYDVPGYYSGVANPADADQPDGNLWQAHFRPDKPGMWEYEVRFESGGNIALDPYKRGESVEPADGSRWEFEVAKADTIGQTSTSMDFRSQGRLEYVGERYLKFASSGKRFIKTGADSPETLLAYVDFANTKALKKQVPLKTWAAHVKDWREGDPTWSSGQGKAKGKGLIGALNYLSDRGVNSISFIPYNFGGDGNNVWPMSSAKKEDRTQYDHVKLAQWQRVFDHAQSRGLFLHFKLQETENDDQIYNHEGKKGKVPAALDGGKLGVERKLYLREMVARFGYQLALNWNLGEENTQSAEVQREMAAYLKMVDPFDHHLVIHTYPRQDLVYPKLLGKQSVLSGASLQNHWNHSHQKTLKWLKASQAAGRQWVVCNDEQGPADGGVPPDSGYEDFNGKVSENKGKSHYTLHDIRKQTLWGTLMAGGAGVEYYFGYKLPANDLLCEDFRSREESWRYAKIAKEFFERDDLPLLDMSCRDDLLDKRKGNPARYCLAKPGEVYLVYLGQGGEATLDLTGASGKFNVQWFNPRKGGTVAAGSVTEVTGGGQASLGTPPTDAQRDWLVVVRRTSE